MGVPYITPGGSFTAAEWNTLFAAQDALLTKYLNGLSPLLTGFSGCNTRKFIFFNPVTIDYTTLHPLAGVHFPSFATGYRRTYDHTAIYNAIDSLADDTSGTIPYFSDGVERLVAPTGAGLTAYNAAVYPEGGSSGFVPDALLQVYVYSGNACFNTVQYECNGFTENVVERVHVWDEIDVIVKANLTFPDTWNKYNLFRFHNFGQASVTITFGSGATTLVIPSGECRCIRRSAAGGSYTVGGNYFNFMVSGDPRFLSLSGTVAGCPSVYNPMGSNALLMAAINRNLDLWQYWDMSSAYASLLAPAGLSSYLGDLLVAKGTFQEVDRNTAAGYTMSNFAVSTAGSGYTVGEVLYFTSLSSLNTMTITAVDGGGNPTAWTTSTLPFSTIPGVWTFIGGVRYSATPSHYSGGSGGIGLAMSFDIHSTNSSNTLTFSGFSGLASAMAAGFPSLTWSFNNTTGVATISGALITNESVDLLDVGTNLFSFLTGNWRWGVLDGSTITYSFPAILGTFSRAQKLKATTATDGYGVISQTVAYDSADTTYYNGVSYSLLDTPQTIVTYLMQMNGTYSSVANARVIITPYGPALLWEEDYLPAAGFNLSIIDNFTNVCRVLWAGGKIVVNRGVLLSTLLGNNCFPANDVNNATGWCFPRAPRRYSAKRAVTHINGAAEPWQTTISTGGAALIPALTSDTSAAGITISASGYVNIANIEWKVFDGNSSTYWMPSSGPPQFLQVLFSTGKVFGSYTITPLPGLTFPLAFSLQASNNGTTWTTLDGPHSGVSTPQTYVYANLTLYTYYRVVFTSSSPAVVALQFYDWSYVSYEPPNVKRFFESISIANESAMTSAAAINLLNQKRLGPIDPVTPIVYGYFQPDTSGILFSQFLDGGGTDITAYQRAFGLATLYPNSTECAFITGQVAQLPGFTEHYNMVASQANGMVVTAKKYAVSGIGSIANNNWLPAYGPSGVPLSVDPGTLAITYSNYFPRNAFCSWMAPASGPDTTANYFAAQGITVQTTLPDGYGTATLNKFIAFDFYGTMTPATNGTYLNNRDANFAAACARYRWVKTSDMRTLYAKFNVPFVLDAQLEPFHFGVINATISTVSGSITAVPEEAWANAGASFTQPDSIVRAIGAPAAALCAYPGYLSTTDISNAGGAAYGAWKASVSGCSPYPNPGISLMTGVSTVRSGFWRDPTGNWMTSGTGTIGNILVMGGAETDSVSGYTQEPWALNDFSYTAFTDFTGVGFHPDPPAPIFDGRYETRTMSGVGYTQTTTQHNISMTYSLDWGSLNTVLQDCVTSIVTLAENISPKLVVAVPKNYFTTASGLNNSVESHPLEITYLDGIGGAGADQRIITTSLAFANLQFFSVDGLVPPPIPASTGSGSSAAAAGGGSGAGGAGGGGGSGDGL